MIIAESKNGLPTYEHRIAKCNKCSMGVLDVVSMKVESINEKMENESTTVNWCSCGNIWIENNGIIANQFSLFEYIEKTRNRL